MANYKLQKNGVCISATIISCEDCCAGWKEGETVWHCTTDDVCFFGSEVIT